MKIAIAMLIAAVLPSTEALDLKTIQPTYETQINTHEMPMLAEIVYYDPNMTQVDRLYEQMTGVGLNVITPVQCANRRIVIKYLLAACKDCVGKSLTFVEQGKFDKNICDNTKLYYSLWFDITLEKHNPFDWYRVTTIARF